MTKKSRQDLASVLTDLARLQGSSDRRARVHVLAKVGYDSFEIVGIYTSEQLANDARDTCEQALVTTGERRGLRSRLLRENVQDQFQVYPLVLNETRIRWMTDVRQDGTRTWTAVSFGVPSYEDGDSGREPTWRGQGATLEEAEQAAREARDGHP